jgi:hypothetical protein
VNVQRGFFRATFVLSIGVALAVLFLSDRPSLWEFRFRPPTEAEKAKAAEWMKSRHVGEPPTEAEKAEAAEWVKSRHDGEPINSPTPRPGSLYSSDTHDTDFYDLVMYSIAMGDKVVKEHYPTPPFWSPQTLQNFSTDLELLVT